jgi:hypothetical protein
MRATHILLEELAALPGLRVGALSHLGHLSTQEAIKAAVALKRPKPTYVHTPQPSKPLRHTTRGKTHIRTHTNAIKAAAAAQWVELVVGHVSDVREYVRVCVCVCAPDRWVLLLELIIVARLPDAEELHLCTRSMDYALA